ncbi:alpha/beta fold hydrolase [Svornostia abyssi]|uniref:Alpha/beta fold hydrolase n=1 Tax=Svornostia abyssi TaxID=2898438 RepID=A0ABY5PB83_9ACTN|nr:alpha/beta fold hydrolase [Parviterribacteraceae bacterium J379]
MDVRSIIAAALISAAIMPAAASANAPGTYRVDATGAGATAALFANPKGSPPGANVPCRPSPQRPRPVILIPGTAEAMSFNFHALAPFLANQGFCVYALNYGWRAGFPALADIRRSAGELAAFVDAVRAETGVEQVDLVGHSQGGGLMPRYYIKELGGDRAVHRLVGIAPSNTGTTFSGFLTLYTLLPNGRALLRAFTPAGEQQMIGSPLIQELNAGDPTPGDVRYDVLVTRYDQVITPYRRSYIDGASAWTAQQGCPLDLSEHLALAYSPRAMTKVANLLDGGDRRLPCRLHLPFAGG